MTDQAPIKSFKDIVIQCPEVGFSLRDARKCFDCPHYLGLQGEGDDMMMVCGRPLTRRLQRIMTE